jgi:hypothetical protein
MIFLKAKTALSMGSSVSEKIDSSFTFADSVWLFVNLAEHRVREAMRRRITRLPVFVGHQRPPPVPCGGTALASFNWIVVLSMFQPATVSSSGSEASDVLKYRALISRDSPGISSI